MTITISIITYVILVWWLAWYVNKPEPDVIKKNGVWIYNKDFETDEIVSIPSECLHETRYTDTGFKMIGDALDKSFKKALKEQYHDDIDEFYKCMLGLKKE